MKSVLTLTLATLTFLVQAAPQYGTVTVSKVISVFNLDHFDLLLLSV
jgi:hypothetical protein